MFVRIPFDVKDVNSFDDLYFKQFGEIINKTDTSKVDGERKENAI